MKIMSESEEKEQLRKDFLEIIGKDRQRWEEKQKEREDAIIKTVESLEGKDIIPIGTLHGVKVSESPMHLDNLGIEIFRFFEVNRANAYTFEGFIWELRHPKKPSLCPYIKAYFDFPVDRSKLMDKLKAMVLKGKIGGMYDGDKKNYFYFFKS